MSIRARLILIIIAVFTAFVAVSCEKSGVQAARKETKPPGTAANNSLSLDDMNFLLKAEREEVTQQTLAQAALDKSTNTQVRQYAQSMADSRSRALGELVRLMKKKGLIPPYSLPEVQLEVASRLSRISGSAFDHEFVSLMAADHQQVVADFRLAAETAEDSDVRNYARHVLPVLQNDLARSADLEKKLAPKG